ncbi:hypothetical protein CRN59_34895, partial [Vibrio vulnificus]
DLPPVDVLLNEAKKADTLLRASLLNTSPMPPSLALG